MNEQANTVTTTRNKANDARTNYASEMWMWSRSASSHDKMATAAADFLIACENFQDAITNAGK